MEYLVPHMLEDTSALLGDFVALYQEWDIHKMQLLYLEQRAKLTKGEAEIEANVLRAEVVGLKQGLDRARLEKEWMEQQLDEARDQLEEAQADLQTARSQITKNAGDLTYNRAQVGKLETELAVLREQLESTSRSTFPALTFGDSVFQGLGGFLIPDDIGSIPAPRRFCCPALSCCPDASACCSTPVGDCHARRSDWHFNHCRPHLGSVGHWTRICRTPSTPRFSLPSGWVFTLLEDVSLTLPPVCTTLPASPSRRKCATDGRPAFASCPGASPHSGGNGSPQHIRRQWRQIHRCLRWPQPHRPHQRRRLCHPGYIGQRNRNWGISSRRPGSHLHSYSHAENIWKALDGPRRPAALGRARVPAVKPTTRLGSNFLLLLPPHTPSVYEENRAKGSNPVANKRIWPRLDLKNSGTECQSGMLAPLRVVEKQRKE